MSITILITVTWALDPIDGTKGFLRGGQYAVCLALIKDGEPVLGVVGCPNLPVDYTSADAERGVIFVAVKGQGAFQVGALGSLGRPSHRNYSGLLIRIASCQSR